MPIAIPDFCLWQYDACMSGYPDKLARREGRARLKFFGDSVDLTVERIQCWKAGISLKLYLDQGRTLEKWDFLSALELRDRQLKFSVSQNYVELLCLSWPDRGNINWPPTQETIDSDLEVYMQWSSFSFIESGMSKKQRKQTNKRGLSIYVWCLDLRSRLGFVVRGAYCVLPRLHLLSKEGIAERS